MWSLSFVMDGETHPLYNETKNYHYILDISELGGIEYIASQVVRLILRQL